MTRYFISTDDDGPNVLFSGSEAELVEFVTSRWMLGSTPFSSVADPPRHGREGGRAGAGTRHLPGSPHLFSVPARPSTPGLCVVCGTRRGPHQDWCATQALLNRLEADEDERRSEWPRT